MKSRTQLSSRFPRGPRPLPRRNPKSASPTSADIRRRVNWRTRVQAAPLSGGLPPAIHNVSKRLERLALALSKTRHQKRPSETGERNHASVAKFRTRRPSHIRKMPRCRAVLSEVRTLAWRDGTGWLGGRIRTPEYRRKISL